MFACCIMVLIALNRFSGFTLLFFLLFTAFYIWQIVTYILGVLRLVDMYNFYTHLLRIPDVSYLPAGLANHSDFPHFPRRTSKRYHGRKLFAVSVPFEKKIPSLRYPQSTPESRMISRQLSSTHTILPTGLCDKRIT